MGQEYSENPVKVHEGEISISTARWLLEESGQYEKARELPSSQSVHNRAKTELYREEGDMKYNLEIYESSSSEASVIMIGSGRIENVNRERVPGDLK